MNNSNGRSWLGIVLIILGSVFLLKNLHIFPYEIQRIIFSWPSILLLIGIFILSKSRDNFMGIIFIGIGAIALSLRIFDYSFREFFYDYWPVLLILLGLFIIYRRKDFSHFTSNDGKNGEFEPTSDNYLDETAVFGGIDKKIKADNFRGGKITAIFGGVDLDFYDAQLADGEQVLDLICIFGGADLIVPPDWQVVIKATAIFGGFDDKRRKRSGTVLQEGKVLVIKGLLLFGGGDIKN